MGILREYRLCNWHWEYLGLGVGYWGCRIGLAFWEWRQSGSVENSEDIVAIVQ